MRSRYIQNGIMNILSDHEFHTLQEIADRLEVHRLTVYRHIQDMTAYCKITSQGGRYGGYQLLDDVSGKSENVRLNKEEIFVIIRALIATGCPDDDLLIRKLKGYT